MNRKYPHFAIPEIYGDSLSYYELLRKLVEAMNAVIENYDTIPDQIAEAVANLDASQLFSAVLNQLIESIATDNTKSETAVKVYKKHDLLYATFNETVNLYESMIDFTTGTETELIVGTNIREVNISELFIELRKIIDSNKKDYITPQMFGAIGDGIANDTIAILNAFKFAEDNHCKLFIPSGTYLVESAIVTTASEVELDRNATLKYIGTNIDVFVTIKGVNENVHSVKYRRYYGGKIDGNYNVNTCIKLNNSRSNTIESMWVANFNKIGIDLNAGECSVISCAISNEYDDATTLPKGTIGVRTINDNTVFNTQITDVSVGVETVSGAVSLFDVRTWLSENYLYDGSIGYKLSADNATLAMYNCTVDTLQRGIVTDYKYCRVNCYNLHWMFSTHVLPVDYTDNFSIFPTLIDSQKNFTVTIYGLLGEIGSRNVKMLNDYLFSLYSVPQYHSSNILARCYGKSISGVNISNKIKDAIKYNKVDNPFSTKNGFEFVGDASSIYTMYNNIKGTLKIKRNSGEWRQTVASTGYIPYSQTQFDCIFSRDGFESYAHGSVQFTTTGNLIVHTDKDNLADACNYAVIPIDYIYNSDSLD